MTLYRAALQVPIPQHMDLYHLQEEAEPSDRTALESVVDYIKKEIEVRDDDSRMASKACRMGVSAG